LIDEFDGPYEKLPRANWMDIFHFNFQIRICWGFVFPLLSHLKTAEKYKRHLCQFLHLEVFFPNKKVLLPRFCPGEPLALEEQKRRKIWGKLGKSQKVGIIISVDFPFQILNF